MNMNKNKFNILQSINDDLIHNNVMLACKEILLDDLGVSIKLYIARMSHCFSVYNNDGLLFSEKYYFLEDDNDASDVAVSSIDGIKHSLSDIPFHSNKNNSVNNEIRNNANSDHHLYFSHDDLNLPNKPTNQDLSLFPYFSSVGVNIENSTITFNSIHCFADEQTVVKSHTEIVI